MIWDMHQQAQITDLNRSADRAKNKASSLDESFRRLQRQMDNITLASQSMWELIRNNTNLTEDDLEKKMLEVDLRDGTADGKISTQVLKCGSCGRNTNSKRTICIMCGAPTKKLNRFES